MTEKLRFDEIELDYEIPSPEQGDQPGEDNQERRGLARLQSHPHRPGVLQEDRPSG